MKKRVAKSAEDKMRSTPPSPPPQHTLSDTRASELHVQVAHNLSTGNQQLRTGRHSVLLQILGASSVGVNRLYLFCADVARLWLMRRGL